MVVPQRHDVQRETRLDLQEELHKPARGTCRQCSSITVTLACALPGPSHRPPTSTTVSRRSASTGSKRASSTANYVMPPMLPPRCVHAMPLFREAAHTSRPLTKTTPRTQRRRSTNHGHPAQQCRRPTQAAAELVKWDFAEAPGGAAAPPWAADGAAGRPVNSATACSTAGIIGPIVLGKRGVRDTIRLT